jgi:hypothetical protein
MIIRVSVESNSVYFAKDALLLGRVTYQLLRLTGLLPPPMKTIQS